MDSGQYLVFVLDGQYLAIPVDMVEQVIRAVALMRLPGGASDLVGLLDLHGEPVPVVDIRKRLGLAPVSLRADNAIVICRRGVAAAALVVDRVEAVVNFPCDEGASLPGKGAGCVSPVERLVRYGDHSVLVCSVNDLLGPLPKRAETARRLEAGVESPPLHPQGFGAAACALPAASGG